MQTRQIRVNGVDLHYQERGSGIPLVLVHGSFSDFRTWHLQMPPFATHYRVVAYSRRYHYPNEWVGDESDDSAALHAEDLATLITSLGLGRAPIVASSFGAYAVPVLATTHAELIRALVLGGAAVNPVAPGEPRRPCSL